MKCISFKNLKLSFAKRVINKYFSQTKTPCCELSNDPMWGCAGWCSVCGKPFEHVRPGKSQPTCNCSEKELDF